MECPSHQVTPWHLIRELEFPHTNRYRLATKFGDVDDIVLKHSANVIQPAIDRLEELDFYKEHLAMLDLRHNRRWDEGLKRLKLR
jgi:hypothetical protein